MSDNKKINMILCTDPVASMIDDHDQETEYNRIEKNFKDDFPNFDFSFERNIFPFKLDNVTCDIYLFDFGGMLPGCEDTIANHYRSLIRQVENHPNTLFILYSTFSIQWYQELLEEQSIDIKDQQNVIYYNSEDDTIKKIQEWFC